MDHTTFTKELLQSLSKDELIEIILLQSEQINALIKKVAELEERLNQNSNNSSRPPSSDGYKKPNPKSLREPSKKKRGGQFGHKGHGLKLQYEIKETVKLSPETCPCCGGDLHDVEGEKTETRYEHDIPQVKVTTTVYEVFEKTCPECGEVVSGTFPESIKSTQQYGANIKALIVLLNQYGMTAINKIRTILESLFGAKISESTIVSTIKNCADRLKPSQEEIKKAVLKVKVVHFDETGMRNNGVLWWLHTASTKMLTYLKIHKKRGKDAMEAAGILPDFKGIAVHDCLKAYWLFICDHALCNAHLLRELIGILENTGQEWAGKMIRLLVEMKETVYLYEERGFHALPDECLHRFQNTYNELVENGLSINPFIEKETGKRGVAKQSKARRLLERLRDHKDGYLLFTKDFDVPFDNNQAERDFRISKLKQKVSGCFRSDTGAESFATIQSIIQTLRKHKINIHDELVKTFRADYVLPFDLVATE